MRATLKSIAEKAGVSKSLVSMHLNGHPLAARIAKDTRRRIDEAVVALDYHPSFTARALSKGKTKTLGLLLGGIANEYFSHLAEAALDEADANGYQLLVSLTKWDAKAETRCLETLLARQVDGVLMATGCPPRKGNCPLLFVDQEAHGFPCVANDVAEAVACAVKALAARGHSRISGLFRADDQWLKPFQDACRREGVSAEVLPYDISFQPERLEAIEELSRRRPQALLCSGRKTVASFLRKTSCPMDIVMNYDVYSEALDDERIIGVVHCKSGQLIRTAVRKLIEMVEGKGMSGRLGIPAEFVPRELFHSLQDKDFEDAQHSIEFFS